VNLPAGLHLESYDARTASDAFLGDLTAFTNAQLHERQPDDPPVVPAQLAASLRHLPDFVDLPAWIVRDGARIVAEANVALIRLDQNQHLTQVQLGVLAPYRRQHLGRVLLQHVTEAAHADGRTLLMFNSNARVPAGEAALRRAGPAGLAAHVNQLDLASLDPQLLERWTAQGQERGNGYTTEVWEGGVPDADFSSYLRVQQVTNDQPTGDLQVEDQHLSAEQLRAAEAHVQSSGRERVLVVADERQTGNW